MTRVPVAYPLTLTFKFLTISSFIRVVDASGQLVSYVKQRAFRLREDVTIFADESVLDEAAYPPEDEVTEEAQDEVVEQFKEFIDRVNPEDFAS